MAGQNTSDYTLIVHTEKMKENIKELPTGKQALMIRKIPKMLGFLFFIFMIMVIIIFDAFYI